MDIIKKDGKAERFDLMTSMLGLSLEEKVEMLNNMYEGKVKFGVFIEYNTKDELVHGIKIANIDKNIVCLELPECGDFLDSIISFYVRSGVYKLTTIKLNKCLKTLSINESFHWLGSIKRLFIWDTTEIIGDIDNLQHTHLEMIVIQHTDGRKPTLQRFKSRFN